MRSNPCDKCGARVIWAITVNDRRMPVDPDMKLNGNVDLVPIPGQDTVRADVVKPDPAVKRHVAHFVTCKPMQRRPAAGPDARPPARTGAPPGARAATSRPSASAPAPPAAGRHPGDPHPNSPADVASDGYARPPRPPELRLELRPPLPAPPTPEEERAQLLRLAAEHAGHARHERERVWHFRRLTEKAIAADQIPPAAYREMANHHATLAAGYADLAEDAVPDCQDTQDAHAAALEAIAARDEIRELHRQAESRIQQAHKEI